MDDPIGAFERLRDNFIRYVQTAFRSRFPSFEQEREALLRQEGVFCKQPWIEPLPRYTKGKRLSELRLADLSVGESLPPEFDQDAVDTFKSLARCGLMGKFKLFTHQIEMLKRSIQGENVVVTAGTGSGKTEAFLLPLFAHLAREARSWSAPALPQDHLDDWWKAPGWKDQFRNDPSNPNSPLRNSWRVSQRAHETRPSGVRALIVYPMNALVEDQMTRLRRALDSMASRKWFDENCAGNRIHFGRYNGDTPIAGHEFRQTGNPDSGRIARLERALKEIECNQQAAREYDQARHDHDPDWNEEARFLFPSLDGSEMRSRWDIQDSPPDILITNFSMLSVMLMREIDDPIFKQTRDWLKTNDGARFHLIIDELHLYRGTAGTEVAYLIRLLLHRLGLRPDHPKLRILASSASLDPSEPSSLDFLKGFFGNEWTPSQIIQGSQEPIEHGHLPLQPGPFASLADAFDSRDDREGNVLAASRAIASAQGIPPAASTELTLHSIFTDPRASVAASMLAACVDPNSGDTRAVSMDTFSRSLFGAAADQSLRSKASRGLLIARSRCQPDENLPNFRLHWLFRNIEGLWASVMPGDQIDGDWKSEDRSVGRLFRQSRIQSSEGKDANRVLETLYCDCCGTLFLGGSRLTLDSNRGWELLPTEPDIEGIPDRQPARFLFRKSYHEYGVFWPKGKAEIHADLLSSWTTESRGPSKKIKTRARWDKASLNVKNGEIHLSWDQPPVPDGNWVHGYLYHLDQLTENGGGQSKQSRFHALPAICPSCNADYRKRVARSPVRAFRTGLAKVSQVLAKELFYELPEGDERKLVVFSDSREDAAATANGMERAHYRDLVRETLYNELQTTALGGAHLASDLKQYGVPTHPLAVEAATANPSLASELNQVRSEAEATDSTIDLVPEPFRDQVRQGRDKAARTIAKLEEVLATRIVSPKAILGLQTSIVIRKLKNLGVNPAGLDERYQSFKYDDAPHRWTDLFDFDDESATWTDDLSEEASQKQASVAEKLRGEVCAVLLSRLYLSFEASGLGYPCIQLSDEQLESISLERGLPGVPAATLRDICNSCIRILGDRYRYPAPDSSFQVDDFFDIEHLPAQFKKFVAKCATRLAVDLDALRSALTEAIYVQSGHSEWKLRPMRLGIRLSEPDDPVWVCLACTRNHLHHSAGTCTQCRNELPAEPSHTCSDVLEQNYYGRETVSGRRPIRLHCEELTAQTDNQAERQRNFRNIVVATDSTIERVEQIDLLSVPTAPW